MNETTVRKLHQSAIDAAENSLPPHMIGGLMRYMEHGVPPGDFLTAVVCNDLKEAFARADESNTAAMREWVAWFYNYAPGGCWGSSVNMATWIAHRGLNGQE